VSGKILLADSSAAIQRVVELMFSAEDVEVVAVDDGEQAIQRLPVERPDVVLADIGTPKRSGYEVAAFITAHPQLSHVPVLLLTGAFEPVDEARVKEVKSAGVLVKPLEPQQVVARVRSLLAAVRPPASGHEQPAATTQPPGEALARGVSRQIPSQDPPPWPDDPGLPRRPIEAVRPDLPVTSLDDYFDRLDAAFATLGTRQAPTPNSTPQTPLVEDPVFGATVPTLDEVLGDGGLPAGAVRPGRIASPPAEPPDASATLSSSPTPRTAAPAGSSALAELFRLLLAAEQGEADATSLMIGAIAPPDSGLSDDLVERAARRVIERLGTDAIRTVVADIVSEVAERLVRAEIDRIRRG
jgi:CheY-like chemotaxis protein